MGALIQATWGEDGLLLKATLGSGPALDPS